MDAEAILGVRSRGAFASTCTTCGATCAHYDHTPKFCASVVELAREFGVRLLLIPSTCAECRGKYIARRDRALPGLCEECYGRESAEVEESS